MFSSQQAGLSGSTADLSQFNENDDSSYIFPDSWVGHEGEWYKPAPGATRFNQYCVQRLEKPAGNLERISRVDGSLM
jgi:hypothetical protein